jgi:hypothetical protein
MKTKLKISLIFVLLLLATLLIGTIVKPSIGDVPKNVKNLHSDIEELNSVRWIPIKDTVHIDYRKLSHIYARCTYGP